MRNGSLAGWGRVARTMRVERPATTAELGLTGRREPSPTTRTRAVEALTRVPPPANFPYSGVRPGERNRPLTVQSRRSARTCLSRATPAGFQVGRGRRRTPAPTASPDTVGVRVPPEDDRPTGASHAGPVTPAPPGPAVCPERRSGSAGRRSRGSAWSGRCPAPGRWWPGTPARSPAAP